MHRFAFLSAPALLLRFSQNTARRSRTSATFSVMPTAKPRDVERVVIAKEQSEGNGARVRRSIGRPELPQFDPFLLLDEFKVSKPAGFPE